MKEQHVLLDVGGMIIIRVVNVLCLHVQLMHILFQEAIAIMQHVQADVVMDIMAVLKCV